MTVPAAGRVVSATVTSDVVDPEALEADVLDPTHGAVTTFVGRVRSHDPEAAGEVVGIDYSCHPDAPRIIGEIARDVIAEYDPQGVTRVALAHRVGNLGVGDVAIAVVVASAHRAATFVVCAELVEAVKARLPMWKQQHEADGTSTWSNLGCA